MFLWFIHTLVCASIFHSLSRLNTIPSYEYSTICSPIRLDFHGFHLLVAVNRAALNVSVQGFVGASLSNFLGNIPLCTSFLFTLSQCMWSGGSRVSDKVGCFTLLPKLVTHSPPAPAAPAPPLCPATPAVPLEEGLWEKIQSALKPCC